jgi:tetratricopeptide (TPR) repeat protein
MSKMDLEKERIRLDREITFFHFQRARKIIVRCLKESRRRQDWFYIYYFTAQQYILNEDFGKAIKYLDKALNLRPKDGFTYNDKAICLAEKGDYESSLRWFNEGINRARDCASLYHNKGWLLNLLEEHNKAILCFHKALELEHNRPESLYSLGDSHFQLGHLREARKYFRKAAQTIKGKSSYLYKKVVGRLKEINLKLFSQ